MKQALKFDLGTVTGTPDPTTDSGEIFLFEEALGQAGRPFVFLVEDPPNKTRARHHHHGDVLYVYTRGEHHIEGEGTYRAGDLRWTQAGHVYGPETTGPEGGAWWVISYSDPIPVDHVDAQPVATPQQEVDPSRLARFTRPYDWKQIDQVIHDAGGAVLEGWLTEDQLGPVNREFDAYLEGGTTTAAPQSGSDVYDLFLGHKTLRLHGLIEKVPEIANLIGQEDLVAWAERSMASVASSVQLNAGELIQIQPDEPAQFLHRDSDSWPVPIGEEPIVVNAIIALDSCTLENGATYIAPGSWGWEPNRQPRADEFARATMDPGDAVFFRGDVIHGGGANQSQGRRRALSISYCAGWLRPVENSILNLRKETVATLPKKLQEILGYGIHDGSDARGGMLGLYECGDPGRVFESSST